MEYREQAERIDRFLRELVALLPEEGAYPPALSVLFDWARQRSNVLRETTSPQAITEALHESPLFDLSSE